MFNFTRAMARQQIGTLYLNPLSGDRFGRRLAQALAADGVQLARPEPVPQPTSLAVVALSEAGHPDYAFYRQGVADRAVSAEGLMRSCDAAPTLEMVCSGCLALAPEDAQIYLPWLAACRQAGKTVVVDANLRPSVMPDLAAYRRHVLAALQLADVVKASDEDLGHLGIAGSTALEQAKNLLASTGASLMALTLGGEGACLLTRGGQVWRAREAEPVKVVDTVGAGDCFLAGLLTAVLLEERPGAGATGRCAGPPHPVARAGQRHAVRDAARLRAAQPGRSAGPDARFSVPAELGDARLSLAGAMPHDETGLCR